MNFWKTSFWAVLAAMARLAAQFVVAKLIAVFGTPATFGIIGQFQSFVSLVQVGAGGVICSGITKYAAEYHAEPERLTELSRTAFKFGLYASGAVGLVIVVFAKPLSMWVFQSDQYWLVLAVFGLTVFGYTLNQMVLSLLNGLNEMKKYASLALVGAVLSVVLIATFGYVYSTKGVLLAFSLSQLILLGVAIFFMRRLSFSARFWRQPLNAPLLKKLLIFSLMSLASILAAPSAQLLLRNYVATYSSWEVVGYWQAMTRISDGYLMLITMVISTYALPQYARISDKQVLCAEVLYLLKRLVPIVAVCAVLIFLVRKWVILTLFSAQFLTIQNLFLFQLLGDVFKIASWVIANVLVAHAQIKTFIVLELSGILSFMALSMVFFRYFGLPGLPMAFCLNYFCFFSVTAIWFWFYVKKG
ncbi:MAG: O-antigen translocase [Candidatus Margulisiibacteriota bacterium]